MTYHVKFTDEEIKQLAKDIGDHLSMWAIHKASQIPGPIPAPVPSESVQKPSPSQSPSPPAHSQPLPPPARDVQNEAMLDNLDHIVIKLASLIAPQFGCDAREVARRFLRGLVEDITIVHHEDKEDKEKEDFEIAICSECSTTARNRFAKFCDCCGREFVKDKGGKR